jgi:branched-chain amino acid transport system substrate-binding protein
MLALPSELPNMSAFSRRAVAIGATAAFIGVLLGLAQSGAEPCPTQCASGKIPLGIAAPTSGQAVASTFATQSVKPVEIAVRELNAAGGLMGMPVELAIADDRCEPGPAINVANRQVEQRQVERDKINFIIGPICPAAAMAAAPIYAKAGVIQFLPTMTVATLGVLRPSPDTIFSMVATDEQEAQALAAYLAQQKGKKLTVVYTDSSAWREIVKMVRAALPAEMTASARFEPLIDVTGIYDRLAEQVQREQPDVIYLALDHAPLVQLVGKLRQRTVKTLLVGGQRMLSYNFWLEARSVAEGIHVIAPIGSPTAPELPRTINLFRQAGVIPDLVALNSFATVQTWAEAVRRAGGGDPKKVIEALRSGDFQTAVGPVAFDQQGNRRDMRYTVLTWQDGQPRKVEQRQ